MSQKRSDEGGGAASKKRVCFVVSPIGQQNDEIRTHADWVYRGIIIPAFADIADFEVVRSDKESTPGMIDSQIIQKLLDSELVIADLTGLNPNVFYEIGIRHMTQKPIIHMQLQDEKIPFDTSLYRTLKFSRAKIDEYHRARQELRAMIEQVLAADYKVDNPITRVRGTLRLQEHATPEQRLLLDQVETLRRRLDELESRSPRSAVNEAWKRFEVRAMLEKGANPEKAKSRLREQLGSLVEVISIRANDRELVAEALAPPSRINLIAPAASRVPEVSGVLVSPLDL